MVTQTVKNTKMSELLMFRLMNRPRLDFYECILLIILFPTTFVLTFL